MATYLCPLCERRTLKSSWWSDRSECFDCGTTAVVNAPSFLSPPRWRMDDPRTSLERVSERRSEELFTGLERQRERWRQDLFDSIERDRWRHEDLLDGGKGWKFFP